MTIAIEIYLQIDSEEWERIQASIHALAKEKDYADQLIEVLQDAATESGESYPASDVARWYFDFIEGLFPRSISEKEHPEFYELVENLKDMKGKY